jgi:hypothetical protein
MNGFNRANANPVVSEFEMSGELSADTDVCDARHSEVDAFGGG